MCLGALSQTILSHSPPFLILPRAHPPGSKLQMHSPLSPSSLSTCARICASHCPYVPAAVASHFCSRWCTSKIARLYYFRGRGRRRISLGAKIAPSSTRLRDLYTILPPLVPRVPRLAALHAARRRYANQLDMFGLPSNASIPTLLRCSLIIHGTTSLYFCHARERRYVFCTMHAVCRYTASDSPSAIISNDDYDNYALKRYYTVQHAKNSILIAGKLYIV